MTNLTCTSDQLVASLLAISKSDSVAILDSCGDTYLDSHRMIAGFTPARTRQISGETPEATLAALEESIGGTRAVFFTLSYEFGKRLTGMHPAGGKRSPEPDLYISEHDAIIVHDYRDGKTDLVGEPAAREQLRAKLETVAGGQHADEGTRASGTANAPSLASNFAQSDYIAAIDTIQERIRRGDTYQANLTHKFAFDLAAGGHDPQTIFRRLRRDSPAAFAAFLTRPGSTVISASPERFFKVEGDHVTSSPVKGTAPRSGDPAEDAENRRALRSSAKDIAENVMIVDLLRNDLGRVCEYGTVEAERLCEIEEHRTLFHLVSTITGKLRPGTTLAAIVKALFPCGSITGAPKISTMRIIDEIEPHPRGLSMGAIGYAVPAGFLAPHRIIDANVAIRTLVVRGGVGEFSVGGGIVIDSVAQKEVAETFVKAEALRRAIGGRLEFRK